MQYAPANPVLREPLQDLGIVFEKRAAKMHATFQRAFGKHAGTETVNRGHAELVERAECGTHNRSSGIAMQVTQHEQIVVGGDARWRRA